MKPPQKPRKPRSLVADRVPPREKVGSIFSMRGKGKSQRCVSWIREATGCRVSKRASLWRLLSTLQAASTVLRPFPKGVLSSSALLSRFRLLLHLRQAANPIANASSESLPSLPSTSLIDRGLTPTKQQRRRGRGTSRPNRIVARTHVPDHPARVRVRIDERVRSLCLFDGHVGVD